LIRKKKPIRLIQVIVFHQLKPSAVDILIWMQPQDADFKEVGVFSAFLNTPAAGAQHHSS